MLCFACFCLFHLHIVTLSATFESLHNLCLIFHPLPCVNFHHPDVVLKRREEDILSNGYFMIEGQAGHAINQADNLFPLLMQLINKNISIEMCAKTSTV